MNQNPAVQQYKSVELESKMPDANPHGLVNMLFDGLLRKLAEVHAAIARKEIAHKGELIGQCIDIVQTLRAGLNHDEGGSIAEQLEALYEYIERRLAEANMNYDTAIINEVSSLVKELKAGWEGIPGQLRK